MSPVPILARQRALTRIGEIRAGSERGDRGPGRKLETFRLTSQHRDIIERCAGLYGGAPEPWQSPAGEAWQLYTTASSLPCLFVVGYSLSQVYELWEGATKRTRRCDGEEEAISGGPCICNANGKDECDIVTRLMVVLPETGTSLGWQLRSTGENAARELAGAMTLATEMAQGRAFVKATLRLTQRRGLLGGQVVRYVVPVLDFDPFEMAAPPAAIGAAREPVAELPEATGHTPVAARPGPTPSEALDATKARKPRTTRAEPIGAQAPPPDPRPLDPAPGEGDEPLSARHDTARAQNPSGGKSSSPGAEKTSGRSRATQRTKEQDEAEGVDIFGAPLEAREETGAAAKESPFKPPASVTERKATPEQRKLLFARGRELGLDEDGIRDAIEEVTGQRSTAEIPLAMVDAVLSTIELRGQGG
jgi:hypothetical protein